MDMLKKIVIMSTVSAIVIAVTAEDDKCSSNEYYTQTKSTFDEVGGGVPAIYMVFLNGSECVVDLTAMYDDLVSSTRETWNNSGIYRISIAFICYEQTEVLFASHEGVDRNYTMAVYLIVREYCVISLDTISKEGLSNNTFIRGLFETGGQIISRDDSQPCALQEWAIVMDITLHNDSLLDTCTGTFPELYTLKLRGPDDGTTLHSLPDSIARSMNVKFPFLLDLTVVDLTVGEKITFPSTDDTKYSKGRFELTLSTNQVGNIEDLFAFNGSIDSVIINGLVADSFPSHYFHNINQLKHLNIAKNCLNQIQLNQFQGQDTLVSLNISCNRLTRLDHTIFNDLGKLKSVDMSNNNLQKIPETLFRFCHSLTEIYIGKNYLKALPENVFKPVFSTIEIVSLSYNPMQDVPAILLYAPNITSIGMQHTLINDESIRRLMTRVSEYGTISTVTLNNRYNLLGDDLPVRMLDLSYCQIHSIPDLVNLTQNEIIEMEVYIPESRILHNILQKFAINLNGNPFDCACNILVVALQVVLDLYVKIINPVHYAMYTEHTIICDAPPRLKGQQLSTIDRDELYCTVNVTNCPDQCECSQRFSNNSVIVDCQTRHMPSLPKNMPKKALELWFRNSTLENIEYRDYLINVTVLDARNSKVNHISPIVFEKMPNLKTLYLDSNLINTFPIEMRAINATEITLSNNPLLCDCRLTWMKRWLIDKETIVKDWESIKCTNGSNIGKQLITVEDTEFICSMFSHFDSLKHVLIPSIVITCMVLVTITLSLLVYFNRRTINVLMYVHCGLHPFDSFTKANNVVKEFDGVVIYDFEDKIFMKTCVVDYLSLKGFKVVDMYRNFIVGLSFSENVKYFVSNSYRVILLVSEHTMDDDLMVLAWRLAYEQSLHTRPNYPILIKNMDSVAKINDVNLKRFLDGDRCINKDSVILQKSLDYYMPTHTSVGRRDIEQATIPLTGTYISYPDDLHNYVRQELIPAVKDKTGQTIGLFEYQFAPGGSVVEEMLNCLEACDRLIFILAQESLDDEIKLMILKNAIARNMTCGYNFLLAFTYREVSVSDMPVDVKDYVNTHVTVQLEDEDFVNRLTSALLYRVDGPSAGNTADDEMQGEVLHEEDTLSIPLV